MCEMRIERKVQKPDSARTTTNIPRSDISARQDDIPASNLSLHQAGIEQEPRGVNGRYDTPWTAFAAWTIGPGQRSNLKHGLNLVPCLTGPSRMHRIDRPRITMYGASTYLATATKSQSTTFRAVVHTTDKASESKREHISRAVERHASKQVKAGQIGSRGLAWIRISKHRWFLAQRQSTANANERHAVLMIASEARVAAPHTSSYVYAVPDLCTIHL